MMSKMDGLEVLRRLFHLVLECSDPELGRELRFVDGEDARAALNIEGNAVSGVYLNVVYLQYFQGFYQLSPHWLGE